MFTLINISLHKNGYNWVSFTHDELKLDVVVAENHAKHNLSI